MLREDSLQRASTHKGKIRITLEQRPEEAAREGVRSLIVRLGDFFGPRAGNNWFSQAFVKPNTHISSITNPGSKGIGHSWAYLPDAGEAFAQLMDRESELANFERFHFRGHWDGDGTEMIQAIRIAAGDETIPVKSLPWLIFKLASPFNETRRETLRDSPPVEKPNSTGQFEAGALSWKRAAYAFADRGGNDASWNELSLREESWKRVRQD